MQDDAKRLKRAERLFALKLLVTCAVCLAALLGLGQWYRTTIPKWDYCLKNNLCFVCHQPARISEYASEELGKNVRLCEEHSTGTQSWRWVVYGVPAMLLMYQDAPMHSAGFMQPLIRGALILLWFLGILFLAGGIIYGARQLISPSDKQLR